MHESYDDIKTRILEEPTWYDQNGTPRYGKFTPDKCPNIYSTCVGLFKICCQECGKDFYVEMHTDILERELKRLPKEWHYGDPPYHNCAGDSMNCEDMEVVEFWQNDSNILEWKRISELEGIIDIFYG